MNGLQAESFELARNTLSQKIMGFQGSYTVSLDLSEMAEGQFAGLACMGKENVRAGICMVNGCKLLFAGHLGTQKYTGDKIWLRLTFDMRANQFHFDWSGDGVQFTAVGEPFEMHFGFWKGARVALYSYNTLSNAGTASFDDFIYQREE